MPCTALSAYCHRQFANLLKLTETLKSLYLLGKLNHHLEIINCMTQLPNLLYPLPAFRTQGANQQPTDQHGLLPQIRSHSIFMIPRKSAYSLLNFQQQPIGITPDR